MTTTTIMPHIGPAALAQIESLAGLVLARILNSLPEGLLIAFFAWAMLRLLPRQNSGTRFAVWFVALLAVAALPFTGDIFSNYLGAHFFSEAARRHPFADRSLADHSFGGHPLGDHPLLTLPGHWGLILFLLWMLAAGVAVFRLAHGLWRLRNLRRSCFSIDAASLSPQVARVVADFSSPRFSDARPLTLATSGEVSVPAAIGFFRPMIVIPGWALAELAPEELRIVLLHEFAHLRRWDDWTNLLQKLVRALFFFQPAVWWIESRLSLEREMACDDHVLAETANPRGYAKCLISLLERSFARRGWAMAQAAVHRAHEATQRLSQILDAKRSNSKHVWKPALGLVGVFSFVCLMIVPHTPRLVGFSAGAPAAHTDSPQYAFRDSQLNSAVVIPAALRLTSPLTEDQPRSLSAAIVHPKRRAVGAPQLTAKKITPSKAAPAPLEILALGFDRADQADPSADRKPAAHQPDANDAPAATTAVFVVRTAERVGPDSYVWSVRIWQVTFVPEKTQKALPAKRT